MSQAETPGFRTVGIYAGALGFGYNSTMVTKNPPACWKDLLDARFKDDIQVANPNSSGTSYTMLIKGGPNPESAKAWYDWALTAKAQEIGATAKSFQVPSNGNAAIPPEAPKLADIKLIDYNFARFGSSEVRSALLARWDTEIGALPK